MSHTPRNTNLLHSRLQTCAAGVADCVRSLLNVAPMVRATLSLVALLIIVILVLPVSPGVHLM